MASRYWVGGTGTWDNSDTTHWAATSNGAGGQSVPGASDDVTFDASSGGGKITLNYAPTVISITGGQHTGTFDTGNQNITVTTFFYSGTGARTLTLGSSTITVTGNAATVLTFQTITNLTLTPNTATFDLTYNGATGTRTYISGAIPESGSFNVKVSAGTDIFAISANSVVKTLDLTGWAGTKTNTTTTLYGGLTITGGTFTGGTNAMTFASTSSTAITITSSVALDFPITLNGVGGTFNLGAALTVGATRTFTVTNGTFDAVSYVLSTGLFSCAAITNVLLGSATHLLTGTGTVWTGTAGCTLAAGTSTLKINDTSNTAITFAGGNLSYNNVWFSRGTSTASNTISGNNFYNDFKDDGSVAHSILFTDASIQTFKTFTVSGTAGQLITINGTSTGTHTLNKLGGGTISCDYLNIQHSIATPSGQWYAGANSVNNQATGTAGSGWNFPRFWVGGSGNWDNATTTHWSATSGGTGGATVPTVSDDVTFDLHGNEATDAAYTVTVTTGGLCCNLDMSFTGTTKVTWAGNTAMTIGGNLNLSGGTAQITRSYTGTILFASLGSARTITMNGITIASFLTFTSTTVNGVVGGYTLQDTLGSSSPITLTSGILNTNGKTVTCNAFTGSGSTYRVLTLGTSNITCTTWTINAPQNLVFSGDSSTIIVSSTTFDGGGLSYGTLTTTGQNMTFTGTNYFVNLNVTPTTPGYSHTVIFNDDITVTGTFTTTNGATATNRILFKSSITGKQRIITAAAISVANADFKDIKGKGAASWDMSAALRGSGDCGGNTMQALGAAAFTTATTQHWVNGNGGSWSTAANWTSRVPLPQDDVVMDCAFGASKTVTADVIRAGKNITWTGATWSTALTFTDTYGIFVFGSYTLISGLTYTASSSTLTLEGRGSYILDSKTVTVNQPVTVDCVTGTYTLGGDTTMETTRILAITTGTLDTSSYVLSVGLISLGSGGNGINATLNLNNGIHLLTGQATVFGASSTAATSILNAGTSTIKITDTTANACNINCAKTLNNVWFSRGASSANNVIQASGIINDLKDDGTAIHNLVFTAGIVVGVTTFTVSGSIGKLISVISSSANNKFTLLAKTGTINCNYLYIKDSLVGGGATWNAGANSSFGSGNYFGSTFGWEDAPAAVKNRYWVAGGDGSYNNGSNWSTTSGGTANATPPVGEIVHFDANSGSGVVTIASNAKSGDFDCTGFTGTIGGSLGLTVSGFFKLASGMTAFSFNGAIVFDASGSSKVVDFSTWSPLTSGITFQGVDHLSANIIGNNGYGDTWTLSNHLNCLITNLTITQTSGTIDANDKNLSFGAYSSSNTNKRALKMGSGIWELQTSGTLWAVANSSQMTLTPSTSAIKISNKSGNNCAFAGGGLIYNNLWFTGYGTGILQFIDSNTFNDIKCENPPHTLQFTSGTVTTYTTFTVSGTPGNVQTINSISNAKSFLKSVNGYTSADYLVITDSKNIGTGYAGTHSIDPANSNLDGWLFTTPSTVISGTVTNAGTPVSGAIVRLILSADNTEIGVTTTNGSGIYTFYADPAKLYHVAVEYVNGGQKYNARSLWAVTPA